MAEHAKNSADSKDHYLKKELYRLIREESHVFDFLQNGSLDGIWYWDLENPQHEWMSPRFWEVFGYDPKDKPHLSEAWQDMIHPEDLQLALDNFHKHCTDPNHPYDQVVRYTHKNGSTVWVRCRGLAIHNKQNKPIRMLGAHTDLTALMEVEIALKTKTVALDLQNEELRRTRDELDQRVKERTAELEQINRDLAKQTEALRRSNRDLEQFAYVASHDLQEPLRGVTSYLQLLEEHCKTNLDEKATEYIEIVIDEAARMKQLIRDLLSYSRVMTQTAPFDAVDCNKILVRVREHLKVALKESNAILIHDDLPTLKGDATQLELVFQNLIANAIKFCGEKPPEIHIMAKRSDDQWQIAICDKGIGIDPKHAERIFVIFQRLHTRHKYPGTGIGLAICKKIIERHGGRIRVESTPGQGATFYLTLPA